MKKHLTLLRFSWIPINYLAIKRLVICTLFIGILPPLFGQAPNEPRDLPMDLMIPQVWTTVANIENTFNQARRQEEMLLNLCPNSIRNLNLPSQATWDAFSADQKALIILNDERTARAGIDYGNGPVKGLPFNGIEANIDAAAQTWAQFLLDNNTFGHVINGSTPSMRIAAAYPANCTEPGGGIENLGGGGGLPVPSDAQIVLETIFGMNYTDAGSQWGHRRANLSQSYDDDYGLPLQEGFVGFGIAKTNAGGGRYTSAIKFTNPVGDANAGVCGYNVTVPTNSVPGCLSAVTLTSPNGGETLAAGNMVNVTWNATACFGTPNVNILLSLDGGMTYPITLVANTPVADGNENVTLPAGIPNNTAAARIRIVNTGGACATTRFLDDSDANFTINSNCLLTQSIICPAGPVNLAAGSQGLNLNLTPEYFGNPAFPWAINSTNADPENSIINDNGDGTCNNGLAGFGMKKYKVISFKVSAAGNYNFTKTGAGANQMSLYTGTGYDPNNPCNNFFRSSSSGGGLAGGDFLNNATLNTCTTYHLVFWFFNNPPQNAMVTITGPGNTFANAAAPGANYAYTYVAVNNTNNQIIATSNTANFTALNGGQYTVRGAAYFNGAGNNPAPANPATWAGQTMQQVVNSGNCVNFSNNGKPLTITGGVVATCPAGLAGTTAPAVQITNSTCAAGQAAPTGGSFTAPAGCPAGSTIQYSTDNGANWSAVIPIYNQTTAMTVTTRCNCNINTAISSQTATIASTPGACAATCPPNLANFAAPMVQVVESTCGEDGQTPTGGTIAPPATPCPAGSSIQYSLDEGQTWTNTLPQYDQNNPIFVDTRCLCDTDNTVDSRVVVFVQTNPAACAGGGGAPPIAGDEGCSVRLGTSAPPALLVTNSTCGAGQATPSGGVITALATNCPTGTSLQFSLNGGVSWTMTLPTYNQTEPMNILSRCNCDADNTISSVYLITETYPEVCIADASADCSQGLANVATPSPIITNSTCTAGQTTPSGGIIAAPPTNCPTGTTLLYSTNGGADWSATLPTYNQTTPTEVLTRCSCDADNTISSPVNFIIALPETCIDTGGGNTGGDGGTANCGAVQFTGGNGQITVSNLTAAREKIEILGRGTNWQVMPICEDNCNNPHIISNLVEGVYTVKLQIWGNDGTYCYRQEEVTVMGGTDGGPITGGTANCDEVQFTGGLGQITVSNLTAQREKIEIIGRETNWQVIPICDNNCEESHTINNLEAGVYTVKLQMWGNDGTYCYRQEEVVVSVIGDGGGNPPIGGDGDGTADCAAVQFTGEVGQITLSNLTAQDEKIEILGRGTNWEVIPICNNNCADPHVIHNLVAGSYEVKLTMVGSDGSACYRQETVQVMDGNLTTSNSSRVSKNIRLNGFEKEQAIEVQWAHPSDLKKQYYVLEKSIDGQSFESILVKKAEGGNDLAIHQNLDENPNDGDNFYRIFTQFENGTSNYSEIINVPYKELKHLSLFPNPIAQDGALFLNLTDYQGLGVDLMIHNSLGQPLLSQSLDKISTLPIKIKLDNYDTGLYSLLIKVHGKPLQSKTFIVARL